MTQKMMFGNDERLCSCKTILENTARKMPDDIPEDRWRSAVMYLSLMQFPDVVKLFEIATELKKYAPDDSTWINMLQEKMKDSAIIDDLPSFETLSRQLRMVQAKWWQRNKPYKYGNVAKSL